MKNKFLVLTLCFTIVFSSINFKKSYASDFGLISAPMLGVISTVALGTGLSINSDKDIYDIGRNFYNKYSDRWDEINQVFDFAVSVGFNGVVNIGNEFLTYIKEFLTESNIPHSGFVGYYGTFPIYNQWTVPYGSGAYFLEVPKGKTATIGGLSLTVGTYSDGMPKLTVKHDNPNSYLGLQGNLYFNDNNAVDFYGYKLSDTSFKIMSPSNNRFQGGDIKGITIANSINLSDVVIGNINDNLKEDNSLDIYVPGNVGSLVGTPSSGVISPPGSVFNPPYDLPASGVVTVPGLDNPSIDLDDSVVSLPNVESDAPGVDIPSDSIWTNITDYVISLVVPSDSYWTDTFNNIHSNFINSFPMVDMSGFNNLVVNGKPFPNIDIKIMGAEGRVVNGDTVNSIVGWLRPIVAGFIFLCLMFFNYRKLYKLIRNTEPFEGVGKVENHVN